jgi:hypothetical protein
MILIFVIDDYKGTKFKIYCKDIKFSNDYIEVEYNNILFNN